jgi:hypothetical protein
MTATLRWAKGFVVGKGSELGALRLEILSVVVKERQVRTGVAVLQCPSNAQHRGPICLYKEGTLYSKRIRSAIAEY